MDPKKIRQHMCSASSTLQVHPVDRVWFKGCQDLLRLGALDQLEVLEEKIDKLFGSGQGSAALAAFRREAARFHVACAKAIHQVNRFAAEASRETLGSIAPDPAQPLKTPDDLRSLVNSRFSLGEARALIRELAGHHRDTVLAHSITPALLVPAGGGDGVVMDLHLELVEEADGGNLHAAPEMLFVHRRPKQGWQNYSFDDAMAHAVQWVKERGFWPADTDVRWRLRRQYADDPWFDEVSGDSAGGAFLFGLLQLLAQAGRIPADGLYDSVRALDRHPHPLRGVYWMCSVNDQGTLSPIGEEARKYGAIRNRSRPSIHTVVAAPEQETEIKTALNPENSVDGICYFFENDPLKAVLLVVAELDGTWRDIFDYRQDWEDHRDALPRPWLNEAYERFRKERIENPGKTPGWLLLDAHARFGKSAFAAGVFGPETAGVAGHFFRAEGGRDDAARAMRSILLQLCRIHRLEVTDMQGADLATLADRVFARVAESATARGELQVVVFDGLDRCSDFAALEELLPKTTPPGLAFVATAHPWMPLGSLGSSRQCEVVTLSDREALADEVREYLWYRRREFDPPLKEEEQGLIELLVERSRGLIGVARDLLAHPEFARWREQPERRIPDGPGAWQGQIWSKGSPLQAIEDYRRKLIDDTSTMEPLGFSDRLPIREAYVPMTTAPPVTSEVDDEVGNLRGNRPSQPVAFREMFAYLAEHFRAHPPAVKVVGVAGSGKTTASAQVAWLLAQREAVPGLPPETLPVRLLFREMGDGGAAPTSLDEFLALRAEVGTNRGDAGKALLDCRQPLLWILDGFDEIPSESRQGEVARWIVALHGSSSRRNKGDRLLLTSRPLSPEKWSEWGLGRIPTFELRDLDDDSRLDFILNYLEQFTRLHPHLLSPGDIKATADRLMEITLEKERNMASERPMARNPMLLSLICFLFASRELPDDWDDLYERFVKNLFTRGIERLQGEKAVYGDWNPAGFQIEVAISVLKRLAWRMQEQGDRVSQPIRKSPGQAFCLANEVKAAIADLEDYERPAVPNDPLQFLRLMLGHVGLMCPEGSETGRMGFLHLNIQEWLAAAHCAANNEGARLAQLFGAKPEDQHEVVRLAVKMRKDVAPNFHHDLFLGLLATEVAADEHHDVFLSRLMELAGVA